MNPRSKVVGILLARMGSSRLPGKSLADVCGKPIIVRIIERMLGCDVVDEVVLATPDSAEDVPLQEAGRLAGATVFAGANEDTLDRLYQAARASGAGIVIHVGGDCPFVDRQLMRRAFDLLVERGADYVSNLYPMTYPAGADIDAITIEGLQRMWERARLRTQRHHCVSYIYQNPHEFNQFHFQHSPNIGQLRWTLDYPEDLEFVRAIYRRLGPGDEYFGIEDILALLEREPALSAINAMHTDYAEDQPAYWDSAGYLADMRQDLADAVASAVEADQSGDLVAANARYAVAQMLLNDLAARAKALAGRRDDGEPA